MEFMISLHSGEIDAIDYATLDGMAMRNNLLRSIGEKARWEIVSMRLTKEDKAD